MIKEAGKRLIAMSIFVMLIAATSLKEKNKPFVIVLLPDTQGYTQLHPEIFEAQTKWIASKKDSIAFVLHLGDITNTNADSQWVVAARAFSHIDGKVPFSFVMGNHDMGTNGNTDTRNTELMNRFLPYSRYSKMKSFGGAFEKGSMDNTWHEFKAGGSKWLVLALEFGPRDSVLEWAGKIIEKHPKHKVIVQTHAYMYSDETRMSAARKHKWLPQNYGIGRNNISGAVNDGEQMWEKLVSKHANIVFAFNGHVLNDGTGKLVSTGVHGNKVYQMLSNYQYGVEGAVKGGNGFLRILTIDPVKKTIDVKTYSPYTGQYKTEGDQQFRFEDADL